MKFLLGKLAAWMVLALALLSILGCASDSELRYLLRGIKSTSINSNIDLAGTDAAEFRSLQAMQVGLAREFAQRVNQAEVFSQPVVEVKTPLRTWGEEISEMSYDGQFKLKLHPGSRVGQWHLEALLQSRHGVILWRCERVVAPLDQEHLEAAQQALVRNLAHALR